MRLTACALSYRYAMYNSRRNELFGISGIRANYPQFFFLHQDGSSHFIGSWSEIENVNETSNLPKDILEANPHILTWDKVFGNVVDSFSWFYSRSGGE